MALVPILEMLPIDSLPPKTLPSEADLLLLLHGNSPPPCRTKNKKGICSESGGCKEKGVRCVLAAMKECWLDKGLPVKEREDNIVIQIAKVKERLQKLKKSVKTMTQEVKQGHASAFKAATVNLAPANYEDVINSRQDLAESTKRSLIAVLNDYVGKKATRFVFYSQH